MSKIPTTVYSEMTPNPKTMKFVADRLMVNGEGAVEFFSKADARGYSDLADDLFNFPFVESLFFTRNFVTVTQNGNIGWEMVVNQLREFVRDYMEENQWAVAKLPEAKQAEEVKVPESGHTTLVEPSDYDEPIKAILEEYVKPAVENDGGAIDYKSFKDGTVTVILRGACSGCPSSTATLKGGIEQLLKSKLEGIKEVVALED